MTQLSTSIIQAIKKVYPNIVIPEVSVFRPDEQFGDFSTAVALSIASTIKLPPMEIAQTIVNNLSIANELAKVQVVAPGFINFWFKDRQLMDVLVNSTDITQVSNPETILVEFGQPNTHKMPHIGHLYSYIYGESLCRLLAIQFIAPITKAM